MSLDDWFVNMRDFMLKHAEDIWGNKKLMDLFKNAAIKKDVKLNSLESFKDFVKTNREGWFDVIFNQKL